MKDIFNQTRQKFPILKNKIQASSCSQSALHTDVKQSIENYVKSWETYGMDWGSWMQACEDARSEFAKMINADISEVAIVSSVSHGISSIATSFQNTNKKSIAVTDFDFPTVGHIWLSQSDKYNINFIESNEEGLVSIDAYNKSVDNDTFIVSTSHVSFYNGFKQDLKKVGEAVHDKGAYLFVDAYQSLGQCKIDVKEMDIDMLTAGLQKYALGTPGIAFLYVKGDLTKNLTPKVTGWFGQNNPFAFDIKNIDYAKKTKRFDTGTYPMINGFSAATALKIINSLEVSAIESYLQELSSVAIEEAEKHGLTVKSPKSTKEKGSNTAIYVQNASEVEQQLAEKGIIVSARNDVIRIAPHFYNTEYEIKLIVKALADLI
ncbi:aminotransferase class V-fold PLP-dependent enzyme [Virgibacillus ihumii]|uniref:aminotransferase class V-fold PLP-dependent enzyme n=1 Tax=Virgibacillus ihumii TaxID=2686091 RepID=UPI00157D67C4|nr:aminotransferase class V-fold PLP-dependent enzyme [Virgibacillus ihumii]